MKADKLLATIDWVLILAVGASLAFGIVVLFSLGNQGQNNIGLTQLSFAIAGLIIAGVLIFVDYRNWKSLAPILYGIAIILLVLVYIFGDKTFGATRWINLGFFQFQPSELTKIIVVLVLARYLSLNKNFNIKNLLIYLFLTALPALLILLQPDLGSASVIVISSFGLLGVSKIPKLFIIILLIISAISLPLGYEFLAPYQKQRVKTYINPGSDPSGSGYNIMQSKIAIGSGGIWGRGLGQGSQSQLNFLPVAHTDFIFAGVAEATGFIGSTVLILLLGLLIYRIILIARYSKDQFGMFFASGIGIVFIYQTLVNIGGNLGLLPITGIPLPFVSFGGTALIVYLCSIGILESIYLRHKTIRF